MLQVDRSIYYENGLDPKNYHSVIVKSPHCEPEFYDNWANKNLNVVSHEVAEKTCEEAANYPVDTAKQFLSQIRLILDKEEPEYVN